MFDRATFGRLLRYGIVGTIAFAIDFYLTLKLAKSIHYLGANSIGFMVANTANFLLAHKFVFSRRLSIAEIRRTYLPVLLISVIGLLISDCLMYIFIDVFEMDLPLSKIVTTICVLLWNFVARDRMVYAVDKGHQCGQ